MTHRRVTLATAAAAAGALALAGCGTGASGSDEPVTLTFAAVTFTESGRGEALEAWVQGFNDSQDQVVIDPVGIPFASFSQTVFTQMSGGSGPDLLRFDQADFVQAASCIPWTTFLTSRSSRSSKGPTARTSWTTPATA